jgi:hypothetical protein
LVDAAPEENVIRRLATVEHSHLCSIGVRGQQQLQCLVHWSNTGAAADHGNGLVARERVLYLDIESNVLERHHISNR